MVCKTKGFTLVELTVAMMLTALAFTIAFAALRLGIASLERNDRTLGKLQELRMVHTLMQHYLAQARPLNDATSDKDIVFVGNARKVEFVAPSPVQGDRVAGLYLYSLRFEESPGGERLVMDYQPYRPGAKAKWGTERETALLVDALEHGDLHFYGESDERDGWMGQWGKSDRLPRMIAVDLAYKNEPTLPVRLVVYMPGS